MPNKELGVILSDYAMMFNFFEEYETLEEALFEMNGGQCAVVASVCAYIARTKYGFKDLVIRNHSLHVWIGQGKLDYDTLYPEGYPQPVTKEWLLKELGESEAVYEVPAGEEKNKGYWDWGYICLFKVMCARWGIPEPSYINSFEEGAHRMTTTQEVRDRKRRMLKKVSEAVKKPLVKTVLTNSVRPFVHYEHLYEEVNSSRVLLKKPY